MVCRHGGGGAGLVLPPHWVLGVHSTGCLRACSMPPELPLQRPPAWWLVRGPVPFQDLRSEEEGVQQGQ